MVNENFYFSFQNKNQLKKRTIKTVTFWRLYLDMNYSSDEEYYNEAGNYIDEVAERILTIKGKPIATLREYLETATIEESNGKESSTEMVDALVNDFEQIVKDSKKIIETAEDSQDQPTADLFIGIKTSLEQHIWMLNAFNKR